MKHWTFIIFLFSFSGILSGQQLPNLGLYREYQSFLNPAAIPHDYFREDLNVHIGLSYRDQWTRFGDGSPVTSLFQGTFVGDQSSTKLILGGSMIYDKVGPINFVGINGKFGVMFSEDPLYGGFSAALTLGYKQQNLNNGNLKAQDITEILGASDVFKTSSPDLGIGLFYHARLQNEDNFFTGLSMPQLFSINDLGGTNKANLKSKPHFYGLFGYIKYLNDFSFIETNIWGRYVENTPPHFDLNLKYQLDQTIWLGIGGSSSKVLHLEAGVVLYSNIGLESPIRIGYSFEDGFNEIANPFGKTHEISLSYAWDSRK